MASQIPSEDGMGSVLGTLAGTEDSTNEDLQWKRSALKKFHKVHTLCSYPCVHFVSVYIHTSMRVLYLLTRLVVEVNCDVIVWYGTIYLG